MSDFIFSSTGLVSIVKFEELGAYFDHPITGYTLSDYFDVSEIKNADTIQSSIDNGHIVAYDENGNLITNIDYLSGNIPIFEIDNYSNTITYVGYGEIMACKIMKISSSESSYTSLFANGNESFDKVWSARTSYAYF